MNIILTILVMSGALTASTINSDLLASIPVNDARPSRSVVPFEQKITWPANVEPRIFSYERTVKQGGLNPETGRVGVRRRQYHYLETQDGLFLNPVYPVGCCPKLQVGPISHSPALEYRPSLHGFLGEPLLIYVDPYKLPDAHGADMPLLIGPRFRN